MVSLANLIFLGADARIFLLVDSGKESSVMEKMVGKSQISLVNP